MSREDARSARQLCDWAFEQEQLKRLLTGAVSVMARKGKTEPDLEEVREAVAPDLSATDVATAVRMLSEREIVETRGSRLTFPSEHVFAEAVARCGTAGRAADRPSIFFWLITSDPTDKRMSRAFGRFLYLAQNTVAFNAAWVGALDEAIALSDQYAVERAANLVGKAASVHDQAFEYIERLVNDRSPRRRRFVCLCLAHITRRHDDGVRLLVQLMKDHVWSVWWAASNSLGGMAVDSVAARWALQMLSKSESEGLRLRATRGLTVLEAGGKSDPGFLRRVLNSSHRWAHDVERNQARRKAIAERAMAEVIGPRSPSPPLAQWGRWGDIAEQAWQHFETETETNDPALATGDRFPDLPAAECILLAAEHDPEGAIAWAAGFLQQDLSSERRAVAWLCRFAQCAPDQVCALVRDLASDPGQVSDRHVAELLESCLAAKPQRAHLWLREIVTIRPEHPALVRLGVIARLEPIARLAGVYAALGEGTHPDTALKYADAVFTECRHYECGELLHDLYHVLWMLMRTSSLRDLTERRPEVQEIIDRSAPEFEPAMAALRRLASVMDLVTKAFQAHEEAGELQYLSEAREAARQLEPELEAMTQALEPPIMAHVVRTWISLIQAEIDLARQRAQLVMELKSKEVVFAESVTLALEVSNVGRHPARAVRVELLGSTNYRAANHRVLFDELAPNEKRMAELVVEPLTREGFRASFEVTFDDGERSGKTIAYDGVVSPVWQGGDLSKLRNPYVPGTPLREGSPIFFGRDDLFDFLRTSLGGAHQENVLLLIGQRRTGKTSALKQLPGRLDESIVPVFIDCQGLLVKGTGDLLHRVATLVQLHLRKEGVEVSCPSIDEFRNSPDIAFEQQFLADALAGIGDRTLALMFDEFEEFEEKVASAALPPEVFGYLRHLMQHVKGLAFVLAGTHKLEELSHEYWSFLFNIALCERVSFLSPQATRDLIVEPVKDYISFDDMAIDYIEKLTSGHPYFLQLTCWRVVQHCIEKGINNVVFKDVHEATQSIIERGEDNLSYLWEMANQQERLVLALLARLLQDQGMAEASDVSAAAGERSVRMTPDDVSGHLTALVIKDILSQAKTDPPRYGFRMKLFQIWIEQSKSVDREAQRLLPQNG